MNNKTGTKFFVKPLYKNIKPKANIKKGPVRKKTLVVDIDSTINLSGHDFCDKSRNNNETNSTELPGSCEIKTKYPSVRNKNISKTTKKVNREKNKSYKKSNSECGDSNNNKEAKIIVDKTNNISKINESVNEMLKHTQVSL